MRQKYWRVWMTQYLILKTKQMSNIWKNVLVHRIYFLFNLPLASSVRKILDIISEYIQMQKQAKYRNCFDLGRSHTNTNTNKHILCARRYARHFTCIISFHPHHSPTFQMHTLRYKKAKEHAQNDTVSKWWIQLLSSGMCSQHLNSLSKLSSDRKHV